MNISVTYCVFTGLVLHVSAENSLHPWWSSSSFSSSSFEMLIWCIIYWPLCFHSTISDRARKEILASALPPSGRHYWSPPFSCYHCESFCLPLHSETLQGAQARTETLENLVKCHFVSLASTKFLNACTVNAALHWPELCLAALCSPVPLVT